MREFHTIVEFSYNEKKKMFITRFLDGTCLSTEIEHLPKKYQSASTEWENAELSKNKTSLIIKNKKKKIELPAHVLYSSGKLI